MVCGYGGMENLNYNIKYLYSKQIKYFIDKDKIGILNVTIRFKVDCEDRGIHGVILPIQRIAQLIIFIYQNN